MTSILSLPFFFNNLKYTIMNLKTGHEICILEYIARNKPRESIAFLRSKNYKEPLENPKDIFKGLKKYIDSFGTTAKLNINKLIQSKGENENNGNGKKTTETKKDGKETTETKEDGLSRITEDLKEIKAALIGGGLVFGLVILVRLLK